MDESTGNRSSLYFPDGDVALSATDKDGTLTFFRVDKVFLRRHSPVFADMFSLPNESGTNELYDGVPLVHLPDTAEDVENLLQILYNQARPFKKHDPNAPLQAMGILKLAQKYQIDPLPTHILAHFKEDWPQTLAEWDSLEGAIKTRTLDIMRASTKDGHIEGKLKYVDDSFPEPASAIRLGTDFNLPSILPAAYYTLALIETERDWDVYRAPQSWMDAYANGSSGELLADGYRTARWSLLDRSDLMRLLAGRDELRRIMAIGMGLLERSSSECEGEPAEECRNVWKKWSDRLFVGGGWDSLCDPLYTLDVCRKGLDHLDELCDQCRAQKRETVRELRNEIWRDLPKYFRLQAA